MVSSTALQLEILVEHDRLSDGVGVRRLGGMFSLLRSEDRWVVTIGSVRIMLAISYSESLSEAVRLLLRKGLNRSESCVIHRCPEVCELSKGDDVSRGLEFLLGCSSEVLVGSSGVGSGCKNRNSLCGVVSLHLGGL